MFPNEWHSFFIYVFFGYLLIFPAAIIFLRLFAVKDPGQRLQTYLITLFTPIAGFILYQTVLVKRCHVDYTASGMTWQLLEALCHTGLLAVSYLSPLLAAMLVIGLLKAVAGIYFVIRLRRQAVTPSPAVKESVSRLLARHCTAMGLACPEVIYSHRDSFVAMTTGLGRPVLVLSSPLIAEFTFAELEHILLHELTHIRRKDVFWGWLLRLFKDMVFFSPFSSLLLERCLLEKERLCDREAAARAGGDNLAYTATLLKSWRLLAKRQEIRHAFIAGLAGPANSLELRVNSLLSKAAGDEERLPVPLFMLSLLALVTITVFFLGYLC
jgi:beta-lactamase regulating signal transducer with metallopeptidase domain